MYKFSKQSRENLSQCHKDLERVFRRVLLYVDCSIICGYRGEELQNIAHAEGNSHAEFPESKHNRLPSLAVDVMPYPVDWKDLQLLCYFGGFALAIAIDLGIDLMWGHDWNHDFRPDKKGFFDLPHFELISPGTYKEDPDQSNFSFV